MFKKFNAPIAFCFFVGMTSLSHTAMAQALTAEQCKDEYLPDQLKEYVECIINSTACANCKEAQEKKFESRKQAIEKKLDEIPPE